MLKEAIEINQNHKVYVKHTPETIDFKHVKHFQPDTIVMQMVIILETFFEYSRVISPKNQHDTSSLYHTSWWLNQPI